jgi:hypothetical protein
MVNDPNPFFIIAGLLPVADQQRTAGQYQGFVRCAEFISRWIPAAARLRIG